LFGLFGKSGQRKEDGKFMVKIVFLEVTVLALDGML